MNLEFKRHLNDLAHGQHQSEGHDWDQKPVGRGRLERRSARYRSGEREHDGVPAVPQDLAGVLHRFWGKEGSYAGKGACAGRW